MRSKRKLTWSPVAQEQWKEILRFYTKRNGSVDYSRRLNKKLLAMLRMIRLWPEIGEETDGVKDYRRHVVEYYAVYYWINDDEIEVAEIRDGRRDEENE